MSSFLLSHDIVGLETSFHLVLTLTPFSTPKPPADKIAKKKKKQQPVKVPALEGRPRYGIGQLPMIHVLMFLDRSKIIQCQSLAKRFYDSYVNKALVRLVFNATRSWWKPARSAMSAALELCRECNQLNTYRLMQANFLAVRTLCIPPGPHVTKY